MPHVVSLSLASEFRLHPALENEQPHWLVHAIYGRELLKAKLRLMRPDLKVFQVRHQPEYDGLLNSMVDVLDLREWPQPRTLAERLKALRLVLRMTFALRDGLEFPTWHGNPPAAPVGQD